MTDPPNVVRIPALLAHQVEPYESPARFKVNRWGRRSGKSVFDVVCAVLGHGPEINGERKWKGLVHGLDVLWVEPIYQQAKIVWIDEIRPRFKGKTGVTLNESEHTLTLDGGGSLYLRSAESIDSVRGLGKNMAGAVLNEAAFFDLQYGWRDVVLPMLLDRYGWGIISGTPNGGHDGNPEHIVPSYFNRLCEEVQQGTKPGWLETVRTAQDNPKIDPGGFAELVAEYPSRDDPKCQQEIFAKLIRGGAGIAFAEWDDQYHITEFEPERLEGWRWIAGLDWGRTTPGCLTLYAEGPGRHRIVRWDWYFADKTAYDAGYQAGQHLQRFPRPEMIVFDDSMRSLGGGESIAQMFQSGLNDALGKATIPLVPCPKRGRDGKSSRQTRKNLMHEALKVRRDAKGVVQEWGKPPTTFHREAVNCIRTISRLVLDEKDTEDINTDQDDHAYDSLTYPWLLAMPDVKQEVFTKEGDKHRYFGRDAQGKKIDMFAKFEEHPVSGRKYQPRRGEAVIVRGDD